MKKLILNISLIGSVLLSMGALQSCNDALDINPQPGTVEDDGTPFKTTEALNGYLMGDIYGDLEPSTAIYATAVISDEVKPGSGSGGQEWELHRFFLNSQDPQATAIWANNYSVINHCNRLVRGAETVVTTGPADVQRLNGIVAQAKVIRAYAYMQLESLYSENMADPNALGVMFVDHVPTLNEQLPRVKNSVIHSFIEADLTAARNYFNDTTNPAAMRLTTQYFVGKSAADAVSARYFLYKGDYAQAKIYAQAVIDARNVTGPGAIPGFPLALATPITNALSGPTIDNSTWRAQFYAVGTSFNPYRQMWVDQNRGESIFSLGRIGTPATNGIAVGTYWNTNASNISGSPMWFWGRNLYNLLIADYANGDVKFLADRDPSSIANPNYATLFPNNLQQTRTTDRIVVDKYPGKTGSNTRNDLKLFRLSEMYFILAECAINDGQLATAAGHIKTVRDARNFNGPVTAPTYANAQAAWADVLKERRVELALEGHRFIDLKRLATKAGVTMDRNNTDDIVPTSNLANGDYRYTFPIPLSELAANPTLQQNTGY